MDNLNYIIIVDDDPDVLESVTMLLDENGYPVIPCRNGEDAITQSVKNDIKLILTDIRMSGISGIDLLDKVHAIYPKMPVILMTGYAELNLAIGAVKRGAFDFITKPFDPEYLLHTIKKAYRYAELLQIEEDYRQRLEETVREQTDEIFNLSREVIKRLTSVAEFRDAETGAHISRIGIYANKIADALKMPIDFIDAITYASCLHDIGKIGISDNILLKPAAFTMEEFEIMKRHTIIGHNMLADSSNSFLQLAASIALYHHEKWDGSGYPHGLRGEEIPIEGRIVIICDQYDALMSRRPYKQPISHSETVKIITVGDGRTIPAHFDPDILQVFKELAPSFEEIFISNQD